jgi:hypothetical protein
VIQRIAARVKRELPRTEAKQILVLSPVGETGWLELGIATFPVRLASSVRLSSIPPNLLDQTTGTPEATKVERQCHPLKLRRIIQIKFRAGAKQCAFQIA